MIFIAYCCYRVVMGDSKLKINLVQCIKLYFLVIILSWVSVHIITSESLKHRINFKSRQYYCTQKGDTESLQQLHELKRKYIIFPWKNLNFQSAVRIKELQNCKGPSGSLVNALFWRGGNRGLERLDRLGDSCKVRSLLMAELALIPSLSSLKYCFNFFGRISDIIKLPYSSARLMKTASE